ncbi:unnamed protein product [Protopolystoma xenopodis]|uniref:Uncharacterized protein n=1 Tax=Protopolystoma xenopodis TaxID=117903 RepID=A0A448XKX0_9PLAT|nr:unnamed protein product [Protopolystoma xenopodis]
MLTLIPRQSPSLSIGSSDSGLQSGSPHGPVDPFTIFLVDQFHSVPVPVCISCQSLFFKAPEARTLPPHRAKRLSSDDILADFRPSRHWSSPSLNPCYLSKLWTPISGRNILVFISSIILGDSPKLRYSSYHRD